MNVFMSRPISTTIQNAPSSGLRNENINIISDCIKFIQFKLTVGFIVNDAALRQMDRDLGSKAVSG